MLADDSLYIWYHFGDQQQPVCRIALRGDFVFHRAASRVSRALAEFWIQGPGTCAHGYVQEYLEH